MSPIALGKLSSGSPNKDIKIQFSGMVGLAKSVLQKVAKPPSPRHAITKWLCKNV